MPWGRTSVDSPRRFPPAPVIWRARCAGDSYLNAGFALHAAGAVPRPLVESTLAVAGPARLRHPDLMSRGKGIVSAQEPAVAVQRSASA